MAISPQINDNNISRLTSEIEEYIGRQISTPQDFDFLSDKIRETTGSYISTSTLMRIWGYMRDTGDSYNPSKFTLRTLCNYIGYRDFQHFLDSNDAFSQSASYGGRFINSATLPADATLTLRWLPNRVCLLRHIADTLFEVMMVENARLRKGDLVECGGFTQNAPVYFSRIYRNGSKASTYIAGVASGVVIETTEK